MAANGFWPKPNVVAPVQKRGENLHSKGIFRRLILWLWPLRSSVHVYHELRGIPYVQLSEATPHQSHKDWLEKTLICRWCRRSIQGIHLGLWLQKPSLRSITHYWNFQDPDDNGGGLGIGLCSLCTRQPQCIKFMLTRLKRFMWSEVKGINCKHKFPTFVAVKVSLEAFPP